MDCLLVKPGVQPGDTILVDLAAAVVDRIASETAAGQIIVDGYNQHPISQVPNSSEPQCSSLTDLSEIVSELTVRLTARGRRVHNTPSGWRKTWESDPYEYPGSQRILEFAIGQEPVIWSAADIDGWSTRCGLLFRP
ncbi:hypothetical protein [Nocardia sp. NBC_00511]|uniref:hypothetical protein n=1 Tax=Nocardia sp. NBC_00511 TaxID=2903591 RepID=UPI0030E3A457